MKKFSNITKVEVGQEPKVDNKLNEQDLFKYSVLSLLDKNLSIVTYGPIDRYLRAGTIKIKGQERFTEALLDFINDNNLKEQVKLLESLKSSIYDWKTIDEKITEKLELIEENNSKSKFLNHKNHFISLLEKYGTDSELILNIINEKSESNDTISNKITTLELLISENKYDNDILNLLLNKYNDLK